MLIAATSGCSTAAAEAACRHIHFFTDHQNAQAYLTANPTLSGEIYD